MTSSGYGVDTAELSSAGQYVRTQAVEQVGSPLNAVAGVGISAADFGREHTHHIQRYGAGIERLVKMVSDYIKISDDFGGRLGGASSTYQSVESQTEHAMQHERGSLGGA